MRQPLSEYLSGWRQTLWDQRIFFYIMLKSLQGFHATCHIFKSSFDENLRAILAQVVSYKRSTEFKFLLPETEAEAPPVIQQVCQVSPICTPAQPPSSSTAPETEWPTPRWTVQTLHSRCHGSSETRRAQTCRCFSKQSDNKHFSSGHISWL